MQDFQGKLAVITGGGTGMGRELARQLAAEGCDVAMCDVSVENMQQTQKLCQQKTPQGTRITIHHCDVSDEEAVMRFRDEVLQQHETERINLLFNNAGVGGAGSFIKDEREKWERTYNICWNGVYLCCRAFVPALVNSDEGHLINTSSVNGFWASIGPQVAHTSYAASKFAVKGFTEALINDFRLNAPHVNVSVVMPGHIGTDIAINSAQMMGRAASGEISAEEIQSAREQMSNMGIDSAGFSDEQIAQGITQRGEDFRDKAPMTAAQAATVILDGVRQQKWRILVGDDAHKLDALVREIPEEAYEASFLQKLVEGGSFGAMDS